MMFNKRKNWKIFSHFINIVFHIQLTHIEMYKSILRGKERCEERDHEQIA
jgi:hypothetical protein